ncbi:hypothetical protein FEM48_Zijuj02G0006600 [Ziziphus jujuba var. spinosa]|uniref:Apple domain-containing protein n=1 Tax=Ziziphus jujuba var. spinosa TaxID=714518 RepID=A0A978VSL0_ZIZJJ|nr:hypothetical protein FEM48_Zijuj02G0006600 [Ziziphus jujuba var. spinosa]
MNYSGLALPYMLKNNNTEWNVIYSDAYDLPCDGYEFCGANAICKTNTMTVCECLQGFTPKFQQEWEAQNWKNGCVRKIDLDCNSEEGFVQIEGVKLPDLLEFWLDKYMNIQECKKACLKNCSCTAYANSDVRGKGSGCLMWFGDLIDVRYFNVEGSEDTIHIRLAASEISRNMNLLLTCLSVFYVIDISLMRFLPLFLESIMVFENCLPIHITAKKESTTQQTISQQFPSEKEGNCCPFLPPAEPGP